MICFHRKNFLANKYQTLPLSLMGGGGGEGFGFLWTLPPGSATVSRHVRYTLYAQYAGINKQNKLYWYF